MLVFTWTCSGLYMCAHIVQAQEYVDEVSGLRALVCDRCIQRLSKLLSGLTVDFDLTKLGFCISICKTFHTPSFSSNFGQSTNSPFSLASVYCALNVGTNASQRSTKPNAGAARLWVGEMQVRWPGRLRDVFFQQGSSQKQHISCG